jgi:alkylation response protein AidB-like acyl-CoA dehydrogenase
MDLDLTPEQKRIHSSALEFLKKESPVELMREQRENPLGYSRKAWKKMAELGWQGIMIPEAYNGMGGDVVDLTLILEAMGRFCYQGPYFSSIVLGGTAIMAAGSDQQKANLLPGLTDGNLILSLALMEPGSTFGREKMRTELVLEGEEFILTGTKLFVENAHNANLILCVAETAGTADGNTELSVAMLDPNAPGVTIRPMDTLAYDKQAEVVFDHVRVSRNNVLGSVDGANAAITQVLETAALAKCAEMVGILQTVFEMTVAYAKDRRQFGKAIGSFQAVQHHCANMVVDVDGARFLTYRAAWKKAQNMPAAKETAMAKAWVSDAGRRVTALGHQIHGAISFCDEHDMHLFYRKAKACEIAFGDAAYHLEKIAGMMKL